ncbi:MAG: 8-oxo-dGTP diphosphatase [Firmicutes bacterium]|nr:8-oxo-dGTP diphosphatase [Bacillota bacterium]
MKLTTMCYIVGPDGVLMLHRVSKKVDINKGKWIGIGGKFEDGESPRQCVIREIREETGLIAKDVRLAAFVTFNFLDPDPELSDWDTEYMFVFVCDEFEGEVDYSCNEGNLAWVPEQALPTLPMWEGDALFMAPVLGGVPFFAMKMVYRGDELVSWELEA